MPGTQVEVHLAQIAFLIGRSDRHRAFHQHRVAFDGDLRPRRAQDLIDLGVAKRPGGVPFDRGQLLGELAFQQFGCFCRRRIAVGALALFAFLLGLGAFEPFLPLGFAFFKFAHPFGDIGGVGQCFGF